MCKMSKHDYSFNSEEIKKIGWIDTHAHLNMLKADTEKVLQECKNLGVNRVITIGTEPEDLPLVLELSKKYAPQVFCTLGIHPHEAEKYNDEVEKFLIENLPQSRVVSLAEIGLDYFYDHSDRAVQRKVFRRQMEIAAELKYPVQIHTREADDDTLEILQNFKGQVAGVIHCFTGTERLAMGALDCGYNISFSGILTFKNAQNLRDIVKQISLDRIHVETDAPFLTPVPLRGQSNEPQHMIWTAKLVAELKDIPLVELCSQLKANAEKMFPRLV